MAENAELPGRTGAGEAKREKLKVLEGGAEGAVYTGHIFPLTAYD